jgi:hypothetical protein
MTTTLTDDDWYVDQEMDEGQEQQQSSSFIQGCGYGFAQKHSGLGDKYSVELSQIAEISNPDKLPQSTRIVEKDAGETSKFSDDHYLSDLMLEHDDIPRILKFSFDSDSLVILSTDNVAQMVKLGKNFKILFIKNAIYKFE